MTLLRKIQDSAVASDKPITDLLRNCKILAVRLGSHEFAQWVDHELNGYPDKESLPEYRIMKTQSAGNFVGPFGRSLSNAPIPLVSIPKEYHEHVSTAHLAQPIGAYADLLETKDAQVVQMRWDTSLTAFVGQDIYEGMNCLSAWQVIPRGALIGILDIVRNRVLNFALEIEKMAPDAGEASSDSSPISEKAVSQVFHTTIYGNVGNVASGNHSVSQTAEIKIAQGDLASLRSQLLGLGFDKEEVATLEVAVSEDSKKDPKQIGNATWGWIGKALAKASQGALKVSASTASSVLAKLISQYLGIP